MRAGGRLALYGGGLAVAFGAAFGLAGVAVPDGAAAAWTKGNDMGTHDEARGDGQGAGHGDGHGGTEQQATGHAVSGVSLSAGGLALSPVEAPAGVGTEGELSFRVLDEDGDAVTTFAEEHGKRLHLIVVRSDGAQFRHVHPVLDEATGVWSAPWTWDAAGTYRVYADVTPAREGASGVTLTRAVQVAGEVSPVESTVRRTDDVDGYTVTLRGDLRAGSSSELTLSVERDGEPVTALEPYLGAYGHLVALREGDLAYLHVHPEGVEPAPGATGGPDVTFAAQAPTAGRYLLYLDFQVDGAVHTAELALDARKDEP